MKPPPAPGLVNRVIILTLLLLTFTGSLGLGAVWMRQEISRTANASRAIEDDLTAIGRRLDEVEAQVAVALNPDALRRQNESMRLALATPREIQVVRVAVNPERRLAERRNNDIFNVETAAFRSVPPATVAAAVRSTTRSAEPFRLVFAALQ